jgi:uncharacterized protein (TIGR03437 family)
VYGSQGYNVVNDQFSYPSYAQVSVTGYTSPTWEDPTTDIRGLVKAESNARVAARWSASSTFTIDLNITDGQTHRVAIYCLDWEGNNRSQRIDIFDSSNVLLNSQSVSSFNGGKYLVWDIRGRVRMVVVRTGARTAVVSGLYFGPAGPAPTPTPTPMPTPTPTPSPSPSPTPSPSPGGNNAPYIAVITPGVNAVFGSGSNIDVTANASDLDGSVVRVDFYRNGSLIGTDTSSPYGIVWANAANGNYTLTAKAIDNLGATSISAAVSVAIRNSPASVDRARDHGNSLLSQIESSSSYGGGESLESSMLVTELQTLANEVQSAYNDFNTERSTFGSNASWINTQLQAAIYLAKSDSALAAKLGNSSSVRNNLRRMVAHLATSEDLLLYGTVTPTTVAEAAAANAQINLMIGSALAAYSATNSPLLAPSSLGSIFGNPITPLSSQTLFAAIGTDGIAPYELGGANVTVGGKAVPVLFVSASQIAFQVGSDVPLGPVEVIVTSQTGNISSGITTITPNRTRLMTTSGNDAGPGIALNANKQTKATFNVLTNENFGSDKRTRVTLYATGISGSAINSNAGNDILVDGAWRPNFAESVVVEAWLSNGVLIYLPVEFAGKHGRLPGLDQINFVLTPQLAGAGNVSIAIVVGGQRSNSADIFVQ